MKFGLASVYTNGIAAIATLDTIANRDLDNKTKVIASAATLATGAVSGYIIDNHVETFGTALVSTLLAPGLICGVNKATSTLSEDLASADAEWC